MNPILDFSGLPRFDLITPADVQPGISQLLQENRKLVEKLTSTSVAASWNDFAAPLTDGIERLSRAWGIVGHLHSVNDIPQWREAYNGMLPEVSRFFAELGQNLKLFAKYKAIRASKDYPALSQAQRKIIDNEVRDFRLSGAELPEEKKPRFQAISEELASLSAKFSENLLDATNAFAEIVSDEAELAGLPDDVCQAAREAAEKDGKTGWKFTLLMPSYMPVMQYADSRRLRAALYARNLNYSMISVTTPAPTVCPPSRIAKRSPGCIATGTMSVTSKMALSPGITISTPSSSLISPVTSVVLK